MIFHLKEIQEGLQAQAFLSFPETLITHLSFDTRIDSRLLQNQSQVLFIALQGHRDGHLFIQEAYNKGIRHFVVSDQFQRPDFPANWYVVKDTKKALQSWAAKHRAKIQYPIFALTGSNGKTIVKEWLAQLLSSQFTIVRSPLSFNSQVGVPLSLLTFPTQGPDFGLVEAGISESGEMEVLFQMIKPDFGIFTHLGHAHASGFKSKEEKLKEKISLFKSCKKIYLLENQSLVLEEIKKNHSDIITDKKFQISWYEESEKSIVNFVQNNQNYQVETLFLDKASKNNLELCLSIALDLGIPAEQLVSKIKDIQPVSMRTEIITDNAEMTIIHDAYTADIDSVQNSFHLLRRYKRHPKVKVILSDLSNETETLAVLEQALQFPGKENTISIGPISYKLAQNVGITSFESLEHFLQNFDYEQFRFHTILLKGARKFKFEQLLPYLTHKATATYLKINLTDLTHNYRAFKKLLRPQTQLMVMLKAAAYGAGSWEIAEALVPEGLDYIGVAYTSEGVALRKQGISLPIMVMNPDIFALEQLIAFDLEPAVGSLIVLDKILKLNKKITIHLEIETGMSRLGFLPDQIQAVLEKLIQNPNIQLDSIFTHLAASDNPWEDQYTNKQFEIFDSACRQIKIYFPQVKSHSLNTSGILRFPHQQADRVRLGIGLYGFNPCPEIPMPLKEIASLHTQISRIVELPAGSSISYNRSDILTHASKIATIPVGYADGIPRKLGNGKMACNIGEYQAATIGRICMDMMMLDVTHIPQVKEGDEVLVFGNDEEFSSSVADLADAAETISYEILSGISERVRRVYVWD